jgi:hypothetical protein
MGQRLLLRAITDKFSGIGMDKKGQGSTINSPCVYNISTKIVKLRIKFTKTVQKIPPKFNQFLVK